MSLKIFDGSWKPFKKIKVYDGSQWKDSTSISIYDGSQWRTIQSLIPVNESLPTVTWEANSVSGFADYGVGQTLTISEGSWTNSPTSYTYQWYSAPYTSSTKNWTAISGATSKTFYVDPNLVGYFIKCEVIAINQYGSSEPATYNMPDGPVITPQQSQTVLAYATSNTNVHMIWNSSLGANGYYIQWWQGGTTYEQRVSGSTNTFDIDTTNFNPNYTIGVYFAPTNNSNPMSSSLGGYYLQGGAKNPNVGSIRPYPPSVSLSGSSSSDSSGTISWTVSNFTQTGVSIYNSGGALLDSSVIQQDGAYSISNGTITSYTYSYLQSSTSYAYYVVLTGTASGYGTIQITSNVGGFTTQAYVPPPVVAPTSSASVSTSGSLTADTFFINGSYSTPSGTAPITTTTWFTSTGIPGSNFNTDTYYVDSRDFGQTVTYHVTVSNSGGTNSYTASYSVSDPRQTYYIGTSTCNGPSGNYGIRPTASGPYLTDSTTSYALPSDTSVPVSTSTRKTVYRTTYAAALEAAKNAACEVPVFAPPFFPPAFAPVFAPPFFPPAFAPVFAPPFFPPFFPPSFACIDEDTLIETISSDGLVVFKKAKDVQVGDIVWSYTWDGLDSEINTDPLLWTSSTMNNVTRVQTNITSVIESQKDVTVYLNGDTNLRFSLEQSILLQRNGVFMFASTGSLEIGDNIVKADGDSVIVIPVTAIDYINESRKVYQFDAAPSDILIAGGILVHNYKGRF